MPWRHYTSRRRHLQNSMMKFFSKNRQRNHYFLMFTVGYKVQNLFQKASETDIVFLNCKKKTREFACDLRALWCGFFNSSSSFEATPCALFLAFNGGFYKVRFQNICYCQWIVLKSNFTIQFAESQQFYRRKTYQAGGELQPAPVTGDILNNSSLLESCYYGATTLITIIKF